MDDNRWDAPVVGIFASRPLAHEVRHLLAVEGFHLTRYPYRNLGALPGRVGPVILEDGVVDRSPVAEALYRESAGPLIRVARRDAATVPQEGRQAFVLPGEAEAFRAAVRWGWVDAAEKDLGDVAREITAPAPVRAAVRVVAAQRPLEPGSWDRACALERSDGWRNR